MFMGVAAATAAASFLRTASPVARSLWACLVALYLRLLTIFLPTGHKAKMASLGNWSADGMPMMVSAWMMHMASRSTEMGMPKKMAQITLAAMVNGDLGLRRGFLPRPDAGTALKPMGQKVKRATLTSSHATG